LLICVTPRPQKDTSSSQELFEILTQIRNSAMTAKTSSDSTAATASALVINAAAFTHSSYALADALATYDGVKVELHISNPQAREHWRHSSLIAPYVTGHLAGFGASGYRLAIEAAIALLDGAP
jgi:3-dehydroquinate dehydratase-2